MRHAVLALLIILFPLSAIAATLPVRSERDADLANLSQALAAHGRWSEAVAMGQRALERGAGQREPLLSL